MLPFFFVGVKIATPPPPIFLTWFLIQKYHVYETLLPQSFLEKSYLCFERCCLTQWPAACWHTSPDISNQWPTTHGNLFFLWFLFMHHNSLSLVAVYTSLLADVFFFGVFVFCSFFFLHILQVYFSCVLFYLHSPVVLHSTHSPKFYVMCSLISPSSFFFWLHSYILISYCS